MPYATALREHQDTNMLAGESIKTRIAGWAPIKRAFKKPIRIQESGWLKSVGSKNKIKQKRFAK